MPDPMLRNSAASFSDLSGVYTLNASEKTRLKVFGYLSRDRFKLGTVQEYAYGNTWCDRWKSAASFQSEDHRKHGLIYSAYQFKNINTQIGKHVL